MAYDFDYWHDMEDMMLKRGSYDPRFDEPFDEEEEDAGGFYEDA